jgi:ABC-2 type transport system permease protein
MVLGLMALLSGALFPVSVMPSFLQSISTISPLRYAYEAARSAALHGAGLGDISGDLLVLLLFGLTAVPISLVLMSGASRYARQRGRLASF